LYVYQNLLQPSLPFDYFALCRLDSAGNSMWSLSSDHPASDFGGSLARFMPLAGNDFILLVNTPSGNRLMRIGEQAQASGETALWKAHAAGVSDAAHLKTGGVEAGDGGLSVKVAANPSTSQFTLLTKSDSDDLLSVSVTDIQGRTMERRLVAANGTFQLGASYKAGFYVVTITQNGRKQIVKLIKE
jgi:hypothetical protein